MKKSTIAGIVTAILAILVLCALAGYLTWQYRTQMNPVPAEKAESEAESVVHALRETAAGREPAETGQTESETAESGLPADSVPADSTSADPAVTGLALDDPAPSVIWVGDSRTLGMQKAVANSDVYIGAAGEGYKWFVETGLDEMEKAIKAHPESVVVLNFGVNDYDNLDKYMELYTSILSDHPDTHFYFLSVNPIDPELCGNITNEEIADFNSHLRGLSPDTYLDSYTEIRANEIQTIDGVHYSQDDYRFIYNYAVGEIAQIENRQSAGEET